MATRSVQKLSTLLRSYLSVFDANDALVTGLVNGNFTKYLAVNGANSGIAVTVTEVDAINNPGLYMATFTPASNGAWYLLITNAANNPRGWEEEYDVNTDGVWSIVDLFTKADTVETGWDLQDTMRVMAAVLCGKVSGGPGNPIFTNLQQSAPRVDSTADANGNRTAVVLTP